MDCLQRLAVYQFPAGFRQRKPRVPQCQDTPRIIDGGFNFATMPDDIGVLHQLVYAPDIESGNPLWVKCRKRLPVTFAFAQYRHPAEPCLGTFQGQQLKQSGFVIDRPPPFLVVVGNHHGIGARP